jgi:hypothetical protein
MPSNCPSNHHLAMPSDDDLDIVPDTDQAMTIEEMAEAFRRIGTPTECEDVELSFDPDDYPLY